MLQPLQAEFPGGTGSISNMMNRKLNLSINNPGIFPRLSMSNAQGGPQNIIDPKNKAPQPMIPNETTLAENLNFLSLHSRIFEMNNLMQSINTGD